MRTLVCRYCGVNITKATLEHTKNQAFVGDWIHIFDPPNDLYWSSSWSCKDHKHKAEPSDQEPSQPNTSAIDELFS